MAPQGKDSLRVVCILIAILSTGSCQNDLDLEFCGTWRHGDGPLSLSFDLSPGCEGILVSANESSLSVKGRITSRCRRSGVIPLHPFGLASEEESKICLYWEPMFDQLKLQVGGKNLTLCLPDSLRGSCCTDLSRGPNEPRARHGIADGSIKGDVISPDTFTGYSFTGQSIPCLDLCNQATGGPAQVNMTEIPENPCARSIQVEMKDPEGHNITLPAAGGLSESAAAVYLPPALQQAAQNTSEVVCTFFQNNSLFQEGHKEVRILNDVVEITVGNEVIADLSEPIRINFHHNAIPKMESRKCVSWDARKDPLQVHWLEDGCVTQERGAEHTECLCNHLTYFSVLVRVNPRPVRHLLALTAITSLGCIVSAISCVALIVFLCRKKKCSFLRQPKEQSVPIHLGLAASLALLNLLFFLTGVLANVGGESTCTWVGAGLHYALLSSFTWMGLEVLHTFRLVCVVFTLPQKPYMYLLGFVLPTVPVIILAAIGDVYGMKKVVPSDDVSNPYLMCWMKDNYQALLAHYLTNILVLVALVSSGIVMLLLVYRKIRNREEWKENRVAFLSIWGLSCLFGTSWGLTFLDFGPLSDFFLFVSCILNSFQGFLLMLRFYMVELMRRQTDGASLGSNSTSSTKQQMLPHQEKS